jgi:hypothetical protein
MVLWIMTNGAFLVAGPGVGGGELTVGTVALLGQRARSQPRNSE